MREKVIILFLFISSFHTSYSQALNIEIYGIRNEKGAIQLSFYQNQETFATETPKLIRNYSKTGMVNGKITLTINDLDPGVYGIALIDDKNENGKIDFRFFIPIEGFGFSNYYLKGTQKPDFEAFAFQFSEGKTTVRIQVKYF